MSPISAKSYAILICLILCISMCTHIAFRNNNTTDHKFNRINGWHMDTLYHPTDSNRFNVALYYYEEIEYQINPETQDTIVIR